MWHQQGQSFIATDFTYPLPSAPPQNHHECLECRTPSRPNLEQLATHRISKNIHVFQLIRNQVNVVAMNTACHRGP